MTGYKVNRKKSIVFWYSTKKIDYGCWGLEGGGNLRVMAKGFKFFGGNENILKLIVVTDVQISEYAKKSLNSDTLNGE